MEYFDKSGSLLVLFDELWDEEDDLKNEIYMEIRDRLVYLPVESQAVVLFYAEEFAGCTKGNYSARTLYTRV